MLKAINKNIFGTLLIQEFQNPILVQTSYKLYVRYLESCNKYIHKYYNYKNLFILYKISKKLKEKDIKLKKLHINIYLL